MQTQIRSFRAQWIPVLTALAFLPLRAEAIDLLVYSNNESGPGSLRQAINDNNALGGGNIIVFSDTVTGTITLTSGELVVTKNVTIIGPGPKLLSLSGNDSVRAFDIINSTASISGLSVINSRGTGGSVAGGGGGILNDHSNLILSNCIVRGNAAYYGGGIFNHGESGSATLTLVGCTLSGNVAGFAGQDGYGGGIYNAGYQGSATLTVHACTLSGNSAARKFIASYGGGIYNDGYSGNATLTISASTFGGNSADIGGGIHNSGGLGTARLELGDTIFKTGSLGANINNSSGTVTSRGYNLCSDNGGGFLTGVGDQINTDPLISPLQDNGGATPTMMPLPGSPAIDQGKRNAIPALASNTDQRGRIRPFTNSLPAATLGDHSDIGAVELNYFPGRTVLNTNDSGEGSLRLAILEVTNRGAINFASDVTGTITLTNGELLIGNSLSVLGPCANQLTISGNDSSRVFNIPAGVIANLSGLTIAHGRAVVPIYGGGIQNNGMLTLTNCVLTANSATTTNGSGNAGGAILNDYPGALTLNGCTISGNFSQYGGALYNHGAITALDTTISANSSSVASTIYSSGSLLFNSCTIVSNNAAAGGGGFQNDAGFAALGNIIVAGNRTTNNASPDVFATAVSLGYDLIGRRDGSVGLTNGINSDQVGSIASPLNPALGPLTDNGGYTATHRLLPGSPAIDKGRSFGLATDQRGAPRPFDFAAITNASGGDGSDIGALELGSPNLNITRVASGVVLSWPAYYGDFQLESIVALSSSNNWNAVPSAPVVVGNQFNVTNTALSTNRFYRLKGL